MILEKLDEDLKAALKAKDETVVSSLRNIKAAIKNAEIEKSAPLEDADVLKVMAKQVKRHKDSIESFQAGGRADLVEMELQQMQILEKYLPAQMSEEAVRDLVTKVIADLNATTTTDFGKVMKEASSRAAGQADGSAISKIVKEILK
jgi:uncharacterized protein YqeY